MEPFLEEEINCEWGRSGRKASGFFNKCRPFVAPSVAKTLGDNSPQQAKPD
jgi:hypothetical protein